MGVGKVTGARFFIAGGAGFIGSHFTDRLLAERSVEAVTLFDNFSSGFQKMLVIFLTQRSCF